MIAYYSKLPFHIFPGKSYICVISISFMLILLSITTIYAQRVEADATVDTDSLKYIVEKISITGNVKTKDKIIYRELTFTMGDTLPDGSIEDQIERSRFNLLNTKLFNYVTITKSYQNNTVLFKITVEERWYLWPNIIFDTGDRNFNAWWEDKNFSRLNYGIVLDKFNFRGRNEKLKFVALSGFRKDFAIEYHNIYLGGSKRFIFGGEIFYELQNEVVYKTENNKPVYYKTFEGWSYQSYGAKISFTYRPHLYNRHLFIASYHNKAISDTVVGLNSEYLGDGQITQQYFRLNYYFIRDKRNSSSYPLTGYYLSVALSKYGAVFFRNNTINMYGLHVNFRNYFAINHRFHFASGFWFRILSDWNPPYSYRSALGYGHNYLRGYENYIIDGPNFFMLKNAIKTALLPTKIVHIKRLPFKKFNKIHFTVYAKLFFDAGYVSDSYYKTDFFGNDLVNQFLYSGGAGIDFVTYYDKMIRIEYTLNSRGEGGIYFHFSIPI